MWYLNITPEQFKTIYGDKVDIKLFKSQPASLKQYMADYFPCKLWRLNNIHTIVNKSGDKVKFNMNYAQHRVYAASIEHARIIILKSRQQGISTFWLVSFNDDMLVYPDLTAGLMAQGADEASTLLNRVKVDWGAIPKELKTILKLGLSKDNSKELSWSNGSTLFIRTSFRSATLQRLHISELAKIAIANPKRAQETKTGTLQAIAPGNTVVIESTAEGRTMFTEEWDKAVANKDKIIRGEQAGYTPKSFMPVFLPWFEDPDCALHLDVALEANKNQLEYFTELEDSQKTKLSVEQRNFWLDQHDELGDNIYQEYPATAEEAFRKVNDGSYYGVAYQNTVVRKGHIRSNLYDSNLDTIVVLDLGRDDYFVLLYAQIYKDEVRIVDEYWNTGEGLEFYVNKMKESGYNITNVVCPHDIKVTELSTNKTRLARLRELGVDNITVLPKLPIEDGIERVRSQMKNLYFDTKCTYMQDCMKNYSKEWDVRYEVWKPTPAKNNWCHGADTMRYLSTYIQPFRKTHRTSTSVVSGLAF